MKRIAVCLFVCLLQKQCCITPGCLKCVCVLFTKMAFDQSSLYSYIEYIAAPGRKAKAESTNSPFSPKRSRKTLQFLLHIFHLTPVKYLYSI